MPSEKVDSFAIEVKLQTDVLNKDFKRLQDNFKNLSDTVKKRFDDTFSPKDLQRNLTKNEDVLKTFIPRFSNILTTGLVGLGAELGVKFAIDFVKGLTSQAHGMQAISEAFHTTPRNLQRMQEIYKRFGGTPEEATTDIAQLYKRAASGMPDQALDSALSQLGMTRREIMQDPSNAVFKLLQKIGAAQGGTPEGTQVLRRNYVGRLGFGDRALQAANQPRALSRYNREVERDLVSNEDIAKQAELDKRFQDLGESWRKIQTTLLSDVLPALEGVTNVIDKLLHPFDTMGKAAASGANFQPNIGGLMSTQDPNKIPIHTTSWGLWDMLKSMFKLPHTQMPVNKSSPLSIDALWRGVMQAETSGGIPSEVLKANARGAFGHYGLRLTTAQDELRQEGNKNYKNLTPQMLMANNYQLADDIAKKHFQRLIKRFGVDKGIKYYGDPTVPDYVERVKRGALSSPSALPAQHSAINHHSNVAYNIDNISLPNVQNSQQFFHELDMLKTTAFSSGRNQLA